MARSYLRRCLLVWRSKLRPSSGRERSLVDFGLYILRTFRRSIHPSREAKELATLVREGIVSIGQYSYGVPKVHVWRHADGSAVGGTLTIGRFCSIATEVEVFTGGEHRTDWASTYPFRQQFGLAGAMSDGHPGSKGDVIIGHDVWIGHRATILSGVVVGHGAVIGAHAVVTKSVRPFAIVAGNPARELRRRCSDEYVDVLLESAWWEWPLDRVLSSVERLNGPIEAFVTSEVRS